MVEKMQSGRSAPNQIVTGQWNPDPELWQAAYGGFGLGAQEGQIVLSNAATLGLNAGLSAQAQAIKADARARGDVVSQIGFGLGEVGVQSAYAAATLGAGSAVASTTRASALIAAHPVAFTRIAQGGAVLASASTGYNAGTAIDAASQGDIAGAVSAAGSATLSGILAASAGSGASHLGGWAQQQRLVAGRAFDASRAGAYPYNQVYLNKPGGGYTRLDSYNPEVGEIVSRKFTQLAAVQERTALRYINEIPRKYPVGASIANVPSIGALSGGALRGRHFLEVPVQRAPIPGNVLDYAAQLNVIIRSVSGRIYP
jgi:hypothetical protein